ncbi:MAG TPA: hypothetical protein VFF30_02610 [Nitrososphaerales archaeon]|nr:hypothetical protein [Nitrososphaerales archaeon]
MPKQSNSIGVGEVSRKLSEQQQASKRGLASASDETRERVARAGGEAPHEKRGLQAASSETRQAVARKGGLARGEQRRKAHQQKASQASSAGRSSGESE